MKGLSLDHVAQGSSCASTTADYTARVNADTTNSRDGRSHWWILMTGSCWLQAHGLFRSLMMLVLCVGVFVAQPGDAQAVPPPDEITALQALYSSTNGNGWTQSDNWNLGTSADPCGEAWYGIVCNIQGTSVLEINLSGNNLTGSISSFSFFYTPNIEIFDVSDNDIQGTLPDWINPPSFLRVFNFSNNRFSGAIGDLYALTSLRDFDVSGNELTGPIPDLTYLYNLVNFNAHHNTLSGPIPPLTGLYNLSWFHVNDNLLSGPIPALSGLANLRYIDVSNNSLIGPIPDLSGLSNLAAFVAEGSGLSGPIPSLAGLNDLYFFWVAGNGLIGSIPPLTGLTNLQTFNVAGNLLTGSIPSLDALSSLQGFLANSNGLTGSIPSLSDLTALKYFHVEDNALTGSVPSLSGLTQLERFRVENNQLVGDAPSVPGPSLTPGVSSLCPNHLNKRADADWDYATGESPWYTNCDGPAYISFDERSVLIELYNLTNGGDWLDNTGWGGPAGTECSWQGVTCDGQDVHVIGINLAGNNLVGTLPASLADLPQLSAFDVSNNQITGDVPGGVGNLSAGQSSLCPNDLDRVANTLWDAATGVTPWYQDCGSLTSVPATERSVLMELYNFTNGGNWINNAGWGGPAGTECSWYGVVCDGQGMHVVGINLPANNLVGTLPISLTGIPQLGFFDVSNNDISGGVPTTAGNLWAGMSVLCPNNLDPIESVTWDEATGNYPWHEACVTVTPEPVVMNTVDDGFDPGADDEVRALAVQPDGLILAGGEFTTIAGESRQRLARLLSDGSLDPGFALTDVDAAVEAIVIQQDGKIVLGGRFENVGGQSRSHIARLNSDGSLDTTFAPVVSGDVFALVLQPDGRIALGGSFTLIDGQDLPAVARLNTDGSVDASFQAAIDGTVSALVLQPDGSIVAGGGFAQVNGQARHNLARLKSDGTLDWRFAPEPDGAVFGLVLQPDGSIVAGGVFTSMGGKPFPSLARVTGSGRVDASFAPQVNAPVFAVLQQADGKLMIGGNLTQVGGQPRAHIARVNLDGSLDAIFKPGSHGSVLALAQQADGSVLLGGGFDQVAGESRDRLARLYPDGSLDTTLDVLVEGAQVAQLEYVGVQPDGRLLLAGVFERVADQPEYQLVRLWPDGRVDESFNPGLEDAISVLATAVLPDGKILVAGSFGMSGGQVADNIVRLNADGSVDPSFSASTDSWIKVLTVQMDGKILIGGGFSSVNGKSRPGLARLNSDGSLDMAFAPASNTVIHAVIPLSNGKLLIGGDFTQVGGISRNYLARLNADGSLDPTFDAQISAQPYNAVWSLLVQPNDKIVLGGGFDVIAGHSRSGLARLEANGSLDLGFDPAIAGNARTVLTLVARTDGTLLVGGGYESIAGVARKNMALVNENGSVDAVWAADTDMDGFVITLAIQTDGKALMGGRFSQVAGQARGNVARAAFSDAALQSLSMVVSGADLGRVSWSRAGTSPELASAPVLLSSLDGLHFNVEGVMQDQDGVWRYDGLVPPLNQNFWLRAQARTGNGRSNGGLIESTRLAYAGFSDLQVENLTQVRMAGKSGWRFDLVNRAPADTDDIIIVTDAGDVERMAFVPVCTTDTVNGAVAVRCQRPAELGIQCDQVGMGERQCSIASLSAGASRSFFVQPADPGTPTIPMTILVNGSIAGQQPLTP